MAAINSGITTVDFGQGPVAVKSIEMITEPVAIHSSYSVNTYKPSGTELHIKLASELDFTSVMSSESLIEEIEKRYNVKLAPLIEVLKAMDEDNG